MPRNLPPGVRESDIPGSRPVDATMDALGELFSKAWRQGVSRENVLELWDDIEKEFMDAEQAEDAKRECKLCHCLLDVPGDPGSRNCGGDCLRCMALAGDPDARAQLMPMHVFLEDECERCGQSIAEADARCPGAPNATKRY